MSGLSDKFKKIEQTFLDSIYNNRIGTDYVEALAEVSDILKTMIQCNDIDGICEICNEYDELVEKINLINVAPVSRIDVKSFLLGSIATIKMIAGHMTENK